MVNDIGIDMAFFLVSDSKGVLFCDSTNNFTNMCWLYQKLLQLGANVVVVVKKTLMDTPSPACGQGVPKNMLCVCV